MRPLLPLLLLLLPTVLFAQEERREATAEEMEALLPEGPKEALMEFGQKMRDQAERNVLEEYLLKRMGENDLKDDDVVAA